MTRSTTPLRLTRSNSKLTPRRMQLIGSTLVIAVISLLAVWFYFLYTLVQSHAFRVFPSHQAVAPSVAERSNTQGRLSSSSATRSENRKQPPNGERSVCDFRNYPLHRYYKLNDRGGSLFYNRPFLEGSDVEYIYGKWPTLLHPKRAPTKVCVDQSSWLTRKKLPNHWPFADGTNPSILHMDRIKLKAIDTYQQIIKNFPSTAWVTTVCMTNSQCSWKDDGVDSKLFDLPDLSQKEPDTVRTLVILLDETFGKLAEATVYLTLDAPWGRKIRNAQTEPHMPALDDARLFLHDQKVYVSFREGPGFGYENQVLHPIHWEFGKTGAKTQFTATLLASESSSFCCGRNMALLEGSNGSLAALTWVDPVTIERVDATPGTHQRPQPKKKQGKRRLAEKHKSHIHGTNAFMVPVNPDGTTLLGIAHFHRPNDRNANEYARFGHHYTHAFYTVGRDDQRLIGLSPEFVLPAPYQPDDAEIIQFISGLEKHGDVITLAYGINDCEAAIVELDWDVVASFLRPVDAHKQVVDLMANMQNSQNR